MKSITVAAMKNALLSYSSNQDDFDEIWFAFVTMSNVHIISEEIWAKFYISCQYSSCRKVFQIDERIIWHSRNAVLSEAIKQQGE